MASIITRRKGFGRSAGDWVLFTLIGVIALVALFAVGRAFMVQQRVAGAFTGWYENAEGYQKAMAEQQASKRAMLVYFYATWCPHCKRFAAEILSSPEMMETVKKYPHVRIEPEHGEAERKLMTAFGAEGFPSFYVVKPDSNPVKMDTHTQDKGGQPRLKTPKEFIRDMEKAAQ
jgi:thiol:disulfide interchange protein